MLDFAVVGSGLTGATIARLLHDAGHSVAVVDRRDHHGGNVHDELIDGIRVHTYGPHYFRTNNERIWAFVHRFAVWERYEARLQTLVDRELHRWPVPKGELPTDWQPDPHATPRNFEEACLAMMPERIYRAYVQGYTEKQWGQPAATLDAGLAGRFNIAPDHDTRLVHHRHQALPADGYTSFMGSMLDGIPLELNRDGLTHPLDAAHTVFTGGIDEYHAHRYGPLRYRAQHREHLRHHGTYQPCAQVNNPGPGPHVRTIEWKHLMVDPPAHSIVTVETPCDGHEYPYPDAINRALYERYKAIPTPDVTICGRLGEYRYYDMDQAIGRAMRIAARLTRTPMREAA